MNNMTDSTDIAGTLQWKIRQVIAQYNHTKNGCHATEKLETSHQ